MAKAKSLRDIAEQQLEEQTETTLWLEQLNDKFGELFRQMQADRLDMLEIVREMRPQPQIVPPAKEEPMPEQKEDFKAGWLSWLGGLGLSFVGAFTAMWTGFTKGIFTFVSKDLPKLAKGMYNAVKVLFSGVAEKFKNTRFFQAISDIFDGVKSKIATIKAGASQRILKGVSTVGAFINTVKDVFSMIGDKIKNTFNIGERLKGVMAVFDKFKPIISGIGRVFSLIGRLFTPIVAIYESFMGVQRELETLEEDASMQEKITAGVKGVIKGLARLVTIPVDLLKDAIAWVAGKLGFETVEEKLKGFSLGSDVWDPLVDWVFSLPKKIGKILSAISDGAKAGVNAALSFDNPVEAFNNAYKKSVQSSSEPTKAVNQSAGQMKSDALSKAPSMTGAPIAQSRTDMVDKSTKANNSNTVNTIVNNYYTQSDNSTNVSNSGVGGAVPLYRPIKSNGSRASAYSSE